MNLLHSQTEQNRTDEPDFRPVRGRIYFSRRAERRFYFILTMIMLAAGILYRLGVIG